MNKVSLYIPCYNVEEFIASCIESALNQIYPIDEILIIDDGSSDRTIEIARNYPVTIIQHSANKGLAAGRNTAVRNARNEFVASLDADCVADPTWLANLMVHFQDPKVAIAGGKLVESVFESLADRWRESHMSQNWGNRKIRNPLFMFGNNSVVRKSVIQQIGYYNESMRTNGEDSDISQRIRQVGHDAIYDYKAVVKHLRYDDLYSILDTYWRHWRFGSRSYFGDRSTMELLKNSYHHLASRLPSLLTKDLTNHKYQLLTIDLLVPAYMIYRDIGTFMKQKSKSDSISASAQVSSSK